MRVADQTFVILFDYRFVDLIFLVHAEFGLASDYWLSFLGVTWIAQGQHRQEK